MNIIKQQQIKRIVDYISKKSDIFNKFVVFGQSLDNNNKETDYFEFAIQLVNEEDEDNDALLLEFFTLVDEITNGCFDITFISDNVVSSQLKRINEGIVVWSK